MARTLTVVFAAFGLGWGIHGSASNVACADLPQDMSSMAYLLLSNGEVLVGQISRVGDQYELEQPGGQIYLKASSVAAVCDSLADCLKQRRQLSGGDSPEDHVGVFDWCVRHRLFDDAAQELVAIRKLDPAYPRLAFLERRLEMAQQAPAESQPVATRVMLPSGTELDRMVRAMPPGTVEAFTNSIQPMLMTHCATAGCHGPNASSDFTLLRVPARRTADRRTTQRNLYAVLGLVDPAAPKHSPLLQIALEPHGGVPAAVFTGRDAPQYQTLAAWTVRVADAAGIGARDLRTQYVQSPPRRSRSRSKLPLVSGAAEERNATSESSEIRTLGEASGDVTAPRVGVTDVVTCPIR